MRELTMDEVKKIKVEMLNVVMDFCGKNGIICWLNGGTLLGAVRHKGYIPWDDDIDLGMLRPDYDRFIHEFNGTNPRYEFKCIETNPEFVYAFGKIFDNKTFEIDDNGSETQLQIDIFVMDNAPDDDRLVQDMFRKRAACIRAVNCLSEGIFCPARGSVLRRVCVSISRLLWMVAHFFPSKSSIPYYVKKIAENSRRYIHDDTKRVGDFVGFREAVCLKEELGNMTQLEFEGKMYNAPVGYHEWLTALYGDYMQLPPPEKRVVSHPRFKAYIKD